MSVTAIKSLTGTIYMASINQKGVSITMCAKSRLEAIVKCWHEYTYYLYK